MIYLDNAATTWPKPEIVYQTVNACIHNIGGSPGRGGHAMARAAGNVLSEAREEIAYLLEIDEIVIGKGANQVGTLKRAGDTRLGSHYDSISSLINMYEATCLVLKKMQKIEGVMLHVGMQIVVTIT